MRPLILGQGLAGTLLSFRLHELDIEHAVVDQGHARSASRAAAGIVNPVTGRRFVKTWNIGELLPLLAVYDRLGQFLGVELRYPLRVLRDLSAAKDLNQWDMRRAQDAYAPYMGRPLANDELERRTGLTLPSVLGPTLRAERVDLPLLLSSYRRWLSGQNRLIERRLDDEPLARFSADGRVALAGRTYDAIIDCRGSGCMDSRFWRKLPWRGTKGEALRFSLDGWPRDAAVKRNTFLCPVGDDDEVWLGATNQDYAAVEGPSPFGKTYLGEAWAAFAKTKPLPKTHTHLAAVRPTTRTRRPFVGEHPEVTRLYLLNGLGGKGTSLGPWAVERLLANLLVGAAPPAEVSVGTLLAETEG